MVAYVYLKVQNLSRSLLMSKLRDKFPRLVWPPISLRCAENDSPMKQGLIEVYLLLYLLTIPNERAMKQGIFCMAKSYIRFFNRLIILFTTLE